MLGASPSLGLQERPHRSNQTAIQHENYWLPANGTFVSHSEPLFLLAITIIMTLLEAGVDGDENVALKMECEGSEYNACCCTVRHYRKNF